MFVKKNLSLRGVVVTGVGIINSMGFDVPSVWQRLLAGQSGVHRVGSLGSYMDEIQEHHPLPDDFPLIAGQIKDFDLKEILQTRKKNPTKEDFKQVKYTDRFTQLDLAASLVAIKVY